MIAAQCPRSWSSTTSRRSRRSRATTWSTRDSPSSSPMTAAKALDLARSRRPISIVLDLALPAIDGLDVARVLRRDSSVPIIMLTARVEESDRLARPGAGRRRLHHQAVQPARAGRARESRAASEHDRGAHERRRVHGVATWSSTCREVRRRAADDAIDLTATEFQLLATLARQPGRVFTRGAAARRDPRPRRRRLRPGHRHARQEHPPQDRARFPQPASTS